ncbi:MAG: MFS transporter [Terriglobales bacterium]
MSLDGESAPAIAQRHAFSAAFLGWMLDAFDFFVVVFLVGTLARQFGVSKADIIWSITLTLAMRPVGALLFGLLSDRYGRRMPLMANVIYFAVIEVACGFAPNFGIFLVLRALFGIGMGGEWGVGAALAMEAAPRRKRGIWSGLLQSGYPVGYLAAALAARFLLPALGWRAMFWAGGIPALLALYVRAKVPESKAWERVKASSTKAILRTLTGNGKQVAYLVALMALMNFLSHGTQDLYPDFLASMHHLTPATVAWMAVLYNVGAVVGAVIFGMASESWGRRRSMVAALALSLVVLPFWSFGAGIWLLAAAAFLMQAGVQGAWGIIPVHLNELAPDAARGLLPGFSYQIGILIAAPTSNIEYALRDHFGYSKAMGGFELCILVAVALVVALGPERKGRDFMAPEPPQITRGFHDAMK